MLGKPGRLAAIAILILAISLIAALAKHKPPEPSGVFAVTAADRTREANEQARHDARLAWQKAHSKEYEAQRALVRKKAAQAQARQRRLDIESTNRALMAQQNGNAPAQDPCETAYHYEIGASAAFKADEYRTAYNRANSGLRAANECNDRENAMIRKAFLLSIRGLAEHNLPDGDSRTDLNQANQLLEECETTPALYGTATAAGCETQQQNNIQAQTQWDIDSYE